MSTEKSKIKQLASYVNALLPIIYIKNFDFEASSELICAVASDGNSNYQILEYDSGLGEVNFKTQVVERVDKQNNLATFLFNSLDEGYDTPTFLVLKDAHHEINDPAVISCLKQIAYRNTNINDYYETVFILSDRLTIPVELENLISIFDMPLPDNDEIKQLILDYVNELSIQVEDGVIEDLTVSLRGMNEFQLRQCLNIAYQRSGTLRKKDYELFIQQKEQFIKKSGLLEMVPIKESLDDIGGLDKLKDWLRTKKTVFNNLGLALEYGVDTPTGIMLVGMPGCGKSLAAKTTAELFQIPLLRLDVGKLFGKYVGESEHNMQRALKLAEAASPCVLWIDEIEKAFSGVGSATSEVSTRLFGQFLTWMQEKNNEVFIVATANNITTLPPEFLRKGRFDELFFIDFPNCYERKKILEIHLKKRKQSLSAIDLDKISQDTKGYNGADLEAIVKEAVEKSFIRKIKSGENTTVTQNDLELAVKKINSISETLHDSIKKIREATKNMKLLPASMTEKEYKKADKNVRLEEAEIKSVLLLPKHDI
ncbi:AAA family ATPase [Ligilactobacillus equi]|uniref:Uncharacterized AAA domain-containing protein ycf46 n=1 Tax=Ligilactobacillus equi DPC 6820 TaxID=1392007 RepID=V7HYV6_9LACO|nr:AAA family ATPase [Ligilactobacillus equi]ETA75072.1 ATP-dependent Zn protease [Ligilactobacillus equi DPC 6820]